MPSPPREIRSVPESYTLHGAAFFLTMSMMPVSLRHGAGVTQ